MITVRRAELLARRRQRFRQTAGRLAARSAITDERRGFRASDSRRAGQRGAKLQKIGRQARRAQLAARGRGRPGAGAAFAQRRPRERGQGGEATEHRAPKAASACAGRGGRGSGVGGQRHYVSIKTVVK